jgi:hypothetical protein
MNPVKVKNSKGGEVFYNSTSFFIAKNPTAQQIAQAKAGVAGFRGYAEEMKGLPASYLLR